MEVEGPADNREYLSPTLEVPKDHPIGTAMVVVSPRHTLAFQDLPAPGRPLHVHTWRVTMFDQLRGKFWTPNED